MDRIANDLRARRFDAAHENQGPSAQRARAVRNSLSSLACVLALVSASAAAQSDLSVTTEYSGFNGLTFSGLFPPRPTSSGGSISPGRPQTLTIVARNNGTAPVANAIVSLRAGPNINNRVLALAGPGCNLSANPPLDGARWMIGAMEPGAQVECSVSLRPGNLDRPWSGVIGAQIGAEGNTDPQPANDAGRSYEVVVSPADFVRDMALRIESPQGILRPGVPHPVEFTLTNLGPGQESFPGFRQRIYSEMYLIGPASREFFAIPASDDPDCRHFVELIGQVTFGVVSEIVFEPLAPGQSRTCTLHFTIRQGATGVRRLAFWNLGEQPGVFDENLANNVAEAVLLYSAPTIPAGSPWGWMLLGLALVGTGLLHARRRHRLRRAAPRD
jgi:hypothetical protein